MIRHFAPEPVVLEGRHVRLEPLSPHHAEALFAASQTPEIWRWLPLPMFGSVVAVRDWIDEAARSQATGSEVPFAILRRSDDVAVGSTRYLDIRRPHRALEIGWTWLAREAQRTAVNTEAKLLLLTHAFEAHGTLRVQLKTDERNERSRAAITRLGATFEGILRNYQTRPHDGYVRNTAMHSITAAEWPAVNTRLTSLLSR